jgi:hypothetical protein
MYRIRPRGADEYERWFDEAKCPVRLARRPLSVKITLAGPERLGDALEQIDAYKRECAERLSELSRERDEIPDAVPYVRADHVLLRMNLSADIFQLEAELKWARYAREMVSWLADREAVWPSARESIEATSEEGRRAREELFGRMAASNQPRPHPTRRDEDQRSGTRGRRSDGGDVPA